jgi:preprotein translocase subunit SecG
MGHGQFGRPVVVYDTKMAKNLLVRTVFMISALICYSFIFAGNASNNRPGDGSKNELTPIQPSKHAEGSATYEPAVSPQHTRVSQFDPTIECMRCRGVSMFLARLMMMMMMMMMMMTCQILYE